MDMSSKKDYAKMLYTVQGVTVQKELAERVGVSAQTINKWVNSEDWEMLRASVIMTKEQELRRLYRRLTFLNDTIEKREESDEGKPITASEADAISKLSKAIHELETDTSISEAMQVMKDFLIFLRQDDFEKARALTADADNFIKSLL